MTSMYSQNKFGTSDGVSQKEIEGKLFMQFSENTKKYFWAIDLDIFTKEAKAKFESLIFSDNQFIACSQPNEDNIWYLSTFKLTTKEELEIKLTTFINTAKTSIISSNSKYE